MGLAAGVQMKVISRRLRHSSPSFTSKFYGDVSERRRDYELELRDLLRRTRLIQQLSARHVAQLIDEV